MFFAPVAYVVLSAVRPQEEGKASGANNAIREVGGVFGVAVLASLFARYGGYESPRPSTTGSCPRSGSARRSSAPAHCWPSSSRRGDGRSASGSPQVTQLEAVVARRTRKEAIAVTLSTRTIAAASARHPWRTIGAWIAVVVLAIVAIVTLLGGSLTTEGAPTNNPESERADEALFRALPPDPGSAVTDIVVIRSDEHTVDSPEFEEYVRDFVADDEITALGRARTYLDDPSAGLSRRTATRPSSRSRSSTRTRRRRWSRRSRRSTTREAFVVSVTGDETLDHDFNLLSQEDLENGELKFGLPAALIILLLVFGAVVAGLVPLLMAMVSIVVALGLTALVAQQFELSVFVINMLTGMGLALGIDYSLFVVSRYREERAQGRGELAAIEASGATASRAVLFSGTVFVIAMFGMLLVPSSIMRSLATGAILVGIVSVVAALTLLPAVLGLLGDRVNALRIPFIGRRSLEHCRTPRGASGARSSAASFAARL